jgi:hypothetical protein
VAVKLRRESNPMLLCTNNEKREPTVGENQLYAVHDRGKKGEREREREETGLAGATQWRDGGPGIPKCLPACLPLVCLLARAMDPGASKDENSFLKGT